MSMIETFNKGVPAVIDKEAELYTAWFGATDFTPDVVIDSSDDINCGALCNELEFVRLVSDYYVQSFDIDIAEAENLDATINAVVLLPRNNVNETDATYRKRFRMIVNQQTNPRRTTRGAIIDALSYFIPGTGSVQVVEPFDDTNLYFEVRLEGITSYDDSVFLNNTTQGFIDQNFIGGPGIGEVITYVGDLIDRIKAVGVDFDVLFVDRNLTTLTSSTIIGTVQQYLTANATIRKIMSVTKTCNATVV